MMMNLHRIVMKLIGPVEPTGEHYTDQARLESLMTLTELVDRLLTEINAVTPSASRAETSMWKIGIHAKEFINDVRMALNEAHEREV